jgi:VWFA-related protein
VVVTDRSGTPVRGLGPGDFTLKDDGQPVKILSFHATDASAQPAGHPDEVIVLLDAVNLGVETMSRVRVQVAHFLRENGGHLAQPVSVFVFTDQGTKVLLQPSLDGNAMAAQLDKTDTGLRTIGRSTQYGGFNRYDLSLKWVEMIAKSEVKRPGKKLLIWAGPGWPLLSMATTQIDAKQQKIVFNGIVDLSTMLREARMSIYSVSMGDPGLGTYLYQDYLKGVKAPEKANLPNLSLKVLATQSGGRVVGPDNDIAAQMDACAQDAKAFYTISFDPPKADHADEYHDLKVEIGKPGLAARTNTGYYNQP